MSKVDEELRYYKKALAEAIARKQKLQIELSTNETEIINYRKKVTNLNEQRLKNY